MSNRSMVQRYSGGSHVSGGGGGGIAGIVDMFLQPGRVKQQQAFEKEMEELSQKHDLEKQNLAAKIAKDSDFQKTLSEQVKGIPGFFNPDGTPNKAIADKYYNELAVKLIDNKTLEAKQTGDYMQSKEGVDAGNRERQATRLKPEVENARALTTTTPKDSITTQPSVPGVNSSLQTTTGPLTHQGVISSGGFPYTDPKTKITTMIGGKETPFMNMSPGSVQQPQAPISADEEALLNKQPTKPDFSMQSPFGGGLGMMDLGGMIQGQPSSNPAMVNRQPTKPQDDNVNMGALPIAFRGMKQLGADAYDQSVGPLLNWLKQSLWTGGTNQYDPILK